MKKLLFAAMFSFCVSASAGIMEDAKSLNVKFVADKIEYAQLEKTRDGLSKRWDDLKWTADQVAKQVDKYKVERADLDSRMNEQKNVVSSHNSRCSGTFTNPGYVNACNSEADQLDSSSTSLNQENHSMNKTRDLLEQAIQTQSDETMKVAAQDKAAMARETELAEDEQRIINQLTPIEGQVKSCQAAIDAVDANPSNETAKEHMHSVCGSMFDGNKP